MVEANNPHNSGYETAYRELYSIINSERHPDPATDAVITVLMETLAGKLTQDEFYGLAVLLERTGTRIRDLDGNVCIDIWGELNGAVNTDGTYDWEEGGHNV